MFLLQLVHRGPLALPSPSWVSYAPQADIIGKKVEWIATPDNEGGRLTPKGLDQLCEANPGPRILILNYPNNPTGLTYSSSALQELSDVAREHKVTVISDEIYGEVNHLGEHHSIASFYPEGTVISSGLSKWCGAGGWRLGYMVFPSNLRHLVDALGSAASETFTSVSAPIQWASIRAFKGGPEISRYLSDSRRLLASLGDYIYRQLTSAGVSIERPEGGFYMFPNMKHIKEGLASKGITTSSQMCEALLNETGVATLPGSCFGRDDSELSLRLSYVNFNGNQALLALAEHPTDSPIDDDDLRRLCGRSVEAADRMARWISAAR
jgi:aspartate aminotransferase